MKHTISTSVLNNPIGTPQSSDGVMMMFCMAVAGASFNLNQSYLLTSVNDLTALGITAAYDTTNGTAVYQQVSEFYQEAGAGALLWLVGVDKSATSNQFANATTPYIGSATMISLIKGTSTADPDNRAKMVGFCYDVPSTTQDAADFYGATDDVTLSLAAMQTLITNTLFPAGFPLQYIIDGTNMAVLNNNAYLSPTSFSCSNLGTLKTDSNPNGSICITGSKPNGVSSVGAALGRFAKISVGHGFNCVADGSISLQTAYLTNSNANSVISGSLVVGVNYMVMITPAGGTQVTNNGTTYNEGQTFVAVTGELTYTGTGTVQPAIPVQNLYDNPDFQALGDKQYMFLRTWEDHSGYFWNDGATACDPTKPLSTQEFGRVANKLTSAIRSFLIDTFGSKYPISKKTGLVEQSYINALQQSFYNESILPLNAESGSGDITDATITLVGTPNGNQINWQYTLAIMGEPIVGSIAGTAYFTYS